MDNHDSWNTSITQGEKKRNKKKLKILIEHFPDLEDICQEILENAKYDLKLAVEQLGGDLDVLNLIDDDSKLNYNKNLLESNAPYVSYPQLMMASSSSNLSSSNQSQMESNQNTTTSNPFSSASAIKNSSVWKGHENNPTSLTLKPSKVNISSGNSEKSPSKPSSPSGGPTSENREFLIKYYKEFYNNIISSLSSSVNVLVLLRGVSGSGKSYLAKILASEFNGIIVSADDHFTNTRGVYFFNRNELPTAHSKAQSKCSNSMKYKTSKVLIVDNTNTQKWEMMPYVKFALQYGYSIEILEPNNVWSKNFTLLAKKSVHNVPFKAIRDQLNRFDKNVTVKDLVQSGTLELKIQGIKPAPLKKQLEESYTQQQWLNSLATPTISQQTNDEPEPEPDTEVTTLFDNQESINKFLDDLIRNDSSRSRSVPNLERQTSSDDSDNSQHHISSTTSRKAQLLFDVDDDENEPSYTPEEKFFKSINNLQKSSSSGSDANAPLYLSNEDMCQFEEEKENIICNNFSHPTTNLLPPPPLKVASAYEIDIEGIESSKSSVALRSLFPKIDSKLLDDIYKKCSGDLNWCAELLLTDGHSMNGEVCNDEFSPELETIVNEASSQINLPSCSTSTTSAKNGDFDDDLEYLRYCPTELENFEETLDVQTIIAKTEERANLQDDLDLFNPIDGDDWEEFSLDKEFAMKLMEIYSNPLENVDLNTLPAERFKIKIPPNLAFELYQLFVLNNLEAQKRIRERQLSGASSSSTSLPTKYIPCSSIFRRNSNSSLKPSLLEIDEKLRIEMAKMREATSGCPKLANIIDVETKLSALETQRVSEIRSRIQSTLCTKMVLGKLHSGFPRLDISTIEEMYLMNGLDYDRTLNSLRAIYSEEFVASGLVDTFPEYHDIIEESVNKEIAVLASVDPKSKKSDLESMNIPELRGLANRHFYIREDYRRRCNECLRTNVTGAAIYYTEMQKLHTSRMIEANNMAASKTVHLFNERNADPNFLDLHCLYVKEATDALLIFLHERIDYMKRCGVKKQAVTVITGRGKNSVNNIAKIQNEVLKILAVQNISHTKLVGHVLVQLRMNMKIWRRDELRRVGCNIAIDRDYEHY